MVKSPTLVHDFRLIAASEKALEKARQDLLDNKNVKEVFRPNNSNTILWGKVEATTKNSKDPDREIFDSLRMFARNHNNLILDVILHGTKNPLRMSD